MTTRSLLQRVLVLVAVLAVALGGIALPAAAKGGPKAGKHQTAQAASGKTSGKAAAQARRIAVQERKAAAKARKAARFVAVGFVTTVDTAEVSILVKGGKKALRRLSRDAGPLPFSVNDDTRIKHDGVRLTLAELGQIAVGDHVVIKGAKDSEGNYVARKLFAAAPEEEETDVDESDQLTEDSVSDDTTTDETASDDTTSDDGLTTS